MKAKNTIGCSDWMRSWGLGPNNKLGKLSIDRETNEFTWKGHQQGRHGQIWTPKYSIKFKIIDGDIVVTENKTARSLPDKRDVLQAVRLLDPSALPKVPQGWDE
jgi:hypothetical protein